MSVPTFEQVSMKLKSSGVPYKARSLQHMCHGHIMDKKHNMSDLGAQKMCGCGGHSPDGDDRPTLPRRPGREW